MACKRRQRRAQREAAGRAGQAAALAEPATNGRSAFAAQVGDISAQFAQAELDAGRWQNALKFAEQADPGPELQPIIAEVCFRLARRAALKGDFAPARTYAERAVAACPRERAYQFQLKAIRSAAGRVLRESNTRYFPDTTGEGSGQWWKGDLLRAVRGWDGLRASVEAPLIMGEIEREHLDGIYALGIYKPWHDSGIPPKFTKYIGELKRNGLTVSLAAILLAQGLTCDVDSTAPDWIEDIDAVVPMATGYRSYEVRGIEITETLAAEVAALLCVPYVDVFERDPDATATHQLSGYGPRVNEVVKTLRVKQIDSADLARANAVLIIDDVVTYGATFEGCARLIKAAHPHVRCYGAALAYTQTQRRREIAESERDAAAD